MKTIKCSGCDKIIAEGTVNEPVFCEECYIEQINYAPVLIKQNSDFWRRLLNFYKEKIKEMKKEK